jgi:hypothetical protein
MATLVPQAKLCIHFDKKTALAKNLGDFFTNSSEAGSLKILGLS